MPIYVYRTTEGGCDECRNGMEVIQSFQDDALTACPKCGGPVEKVLTAFSAGKGSRLGSANLKDHGFRKLQRKDEGGYADIT